MSEDEVPDVAIADMISGGELTVWTHGPDNRKYLVPAGGKAWFVTRLTKAIREGRADGSGRIAYNVLCEWLAKNAKEIEHHEGFPNLLR